MAFSGGPVYGIGVSVGVSDGVGLMVCVLVAVFVGVNVAVCVNVGVKVAVTESAKIWAVSVISAFTVSMAAVMVRSGPSVGVAAAWGNREQPVPHMENVPRNSDKAMAIKTAFLLFIYSPF